MKAMLLAGVAASVAAVLTFGSSVQAAPGDTLKAVKDRGVLNCPGHNGSYLGFAEVDDKGVWKGLDIDLCRALATAIFDDPDKIKVVPISWTQRWPAGRGRRASCCRPAAAMTAAMPSAWDLPARRRSAMP